MANPTSAVLTSELKLFARDPGSLFWIIVFPPLLVAILGFIPEFDNPDEGVDGVPVIALYVPVAVLLAALLAGVSSMPVVLASYREQGVLRRIATTPARPRDLLISQYLLHGAAAVIGGLLAMAVAWFRHGVGLPGNAFAYVVMLFLALAACLAIGGVVSGVAPTGKIATTIGTVLLFPMMFTAGVWLPVQAMPGLVGDIVAFTPLGAAALGLDAAAAGNWPAWRDVAVVLAWTLGLGTIAARYFRWD